MTVMFRAPGYGVTDLVGASGPTSLLTALLWLSRSGRASPEAVQAWQLRRLQVVVEHAQDNVALYRHLYAAEVAPRVRSLDDFRRLPTTEKSFYRDDAHATLAGKVPANARTVTTSGSTGEPFTVVYPPGTAAYLGVLRLHVDRARGISLSSTRVDVSRHADTRRRRGAVAAFGQRLRTVDAALPAPAVADEIARLRPARVSGFGHLLADVGGALTGDHRPRVVATYGENVDGLVRRELAELWGSTPLDGYGTAEHGTVAWQCPKADLYHLAHQWAYVEVIDDEGRPVEPGGTGTVLLTSLTNPLMPFIRYRPGDTATLADRPCACGSRQPALAGIDGRQLDWLVDGTGRRLSPQDANLTMVLTGEELARHVRRYRVHQDGSGLVIVEVVAKHDALPPELMTRVESRYRQLMRGREIRVTQVAELALGPSGKFRMVGSDLASAGAPPRAAR